MPKDGDNVLVRAEPSSLDLLNTVSVKVPAFWPDSAEAWFVQVEAQFALKGVTASLTKFYYASRLSIKRLPTKSWILSSPLRPLSPTKPWSNGCWSFLPSTISRGMRRSLVYHCLEIWSHQSGCQVCWPCYQWVINHIFFSGELFLRGYLQKYELTYSGTIFLILYLSPWKLTKSIKAEWPLTLCTPFPAPQRILSKLWGLQPKLHQLKSQHHTTLTPLFLTHLTWTPTAQAVQIV